MLWLLAACATPEPEPEPTGSATTPTSDTSAPTCDDWTCDDPGAELSGSFADELATSCALLDPTTFEAWRCETPDGAPYDVIRSGFLHYGQDTWWFDATTDTLVARERAFDDTIYCCDTTDRYTWGVPPVDCARVSDHTCE